MDNLLAILAFLAAALLIGTLLYLPMRWLVRRRTPAPSKSPPVTPEHLFVAAAVVGSLLALIWFIEAGSRFATILYSVAMLIAGIAAVIILKRSQQADENDDA